MNLIQRIIRRPVALAMVVLVAVLLGTISLSRLKIDLLPEFKMPYAVVISSYAGAGPEEVEKSVTRPLEEVMGTVQGIKNIYSYSSTGSSIVLLEFEWGQDLDFATLDIREKIDLVQMMLPDGVDKPTVMKMDPNIMPVLVLAMHGDMDQQRLKDLAENVVKNRLERLDGVASVSVVGGLQREIQVLVDTVQLHSYGLSISQVVQALQMENNTFAAGKVADAGKDVLVRVSGEFSDLDQIRQVSLTTARGTVHLGDIAEVRDYHQEQESIALYNGQPAIGLSIQKQSGANSVEVSRAVKAALQELQNDLPPGVAIETAMDQSEYVEAAISGVYRDMLLGGLLAMLIIFIFLRNLRGTVVIGLTIPIAVITTFVLIYFNNLTLNLLTLGGLSLGVGRMVDDAIVVFDNIYRHRQGGKDAMTAAASGTQQVITAVTAATLTTVAVFLPIAFVRGLAAEIFAPLALTVSFSLLASLAVSLTVTPTVAARILAAPLPPEPQRAAGFWGNIKSGFWLNNLGNNYSRLLAWALDHRLLVVVVVTLIFAGSLALIPAVGVEFMPATDEGTISVTIELPRGSQLEATLAVAEQVAELARKQPEVTDIYLQVGGGGMMSTEGESAETASLTIELLPLKERRRSSEEVAIALRQDTAKIAGAQITVTPSSFFGTEMLGSPVQVDISGSDLEVLEELSTVVQQAVEQVPGTVAVKNSITEGRPQLQVVIDREKAALYDLNVYQIGSSVATAVKGQVANRYRIDGEEYDVRVILPKEERQNISDLANLTVLSPLGVQVPLKELAELKMDTTPITISRYNQDRVVSITADLSGRPLAEVMADIKTAVDKINLPQGYSVAYMGQSEAMSETFGELGIALLLAVVLVYMVMAAQFESLFYPFVIMFAIPVSLVGVVLALLISGRTFNIVAFMGVIMMCGIVLSNAIILVDYINILRREGTPRRKAIVEAGRTRLRPILMTTLTTILAMAPLATGIGEGAEMEAGLATAVIGGLTASTVLTLVLVPVLYTILEDLGRRLAVLLRLEKRQHHNAGA
ncbi:MAG: efflux RND transporter permease subunit [Clostridia bacterium]|nr:efflux RND transporter permease subunit [Clostridia bacterium]